MLALDNIGLAFGNHWLFKEATYQFQPGERVGLIGRNGAGKSTLLKIIAGERSPTEGQVILSKNSQIAFFNQELLSYETDRSIVEVARDAFAPLLELKAEIEALNTRLEAGESSPELWDQLAQKQDEFEAKGGQQIEASVHHTLAGLGFKAHEHDQPFKIFSGGWRMRVLLAKMLLMKPTVLMLDEPTNHLDLPSIQWLEDYLKGYPGVCIIVSHDRFFLDRLVNKVLELSLKRLNVYAGNYAYYIKEKALREEQHIRSYENQQQYIAEQERFINRFRAKASKARQVQSKIKQLEKLERLEAPETEGFSFKLQFKVKQRSGKEVMKLAKLHKAYGEKRILNDSTGSIWRGEKIALIGANGLGKSTLLRIIAGTESFEGERTLGHQVNASFFAQHQLESLDLKNNIFDEIATAAPGENETYLRSILGCFMFSGDDILKKIQVLSGGEKSRVALAKTLLSDANFLLLDEPTNHLDIQSIQVLVDALNAYEGTYVVVSHDRYFLDKVANKIWYLEDQQIKEYPGTYQEYMRWQAQREAGTALETPLVQDPQASSPQPDTKPAPDKLDYQQQKQRKNRIKSLEKQIPDCETKIEELENRVAQLQLKMASPEVAADFTKLNEIQQEIETVEQQLAEENSTWETLVMELEELQA